MAQDAGAGAEADEAAMDAMFMGEPCGEDRYLQRCWKNGNDEKMEIEDRNARHGPYFR